MAITEPGVHQISYELLEDMLSMPMQLAITSIENMDSTTGYFTILVEKRPQPE